jgi:DNA-binding HxlR family transcriptional regulator
MRPASQQTPAGRTAKPRIEARAAMASRRAAAAKTRPAAAPAKPRSADPDGPACCPYYHEAVELIGKRWTGAILRVLLDRAMRFSEIAQAVPELSDRLLSERMKELEARGVVSRHVDPGPPLRVEYTLSAMGRDLEPALEEIQAWAQRWIAPGSRRRT